MAKELNLKKGNLVKKGFSGFSWTVFFWGCFVPLIRGDWKWFWICFLFSWTGIQIVMCFIYNKIYTRHVLEQGYEPADDYSKNVLTQMGLYNVN